VDHLAASSSSADLLEGSIAAMWNGFHVDDYYPSQENEMAVAHSKPKGPIKTTDAWQWPKATKPEPFAVADKLPQRPTKGMLAYEAEKRMKEEAEMASVRPTPKARPAPRDTWEPKFAEMKAKEEARRRQYEASRRRLETAARRRLAREESPVAQEQETPSRQFRARPAPRQILDSDVFQQMLEEDSYRQARRRVRAARALQLARAPGAHESRLQAIALGWDRKSKTMRHEGKRKEAKINNGAKVTTPRPFKLTEATPESEKVARVLAKMAHDEATGHEQRWPFSGRRGPQQRPVGLSREGQAYIALGRAAGQRSPATTRAARLRGAHVSRGVHLNDLETRAFGVKLSKTYQHHYANHVRPRFITNSRNRKCRSCAARRRSASERSAKSSSR
jgi:hypothetical protein